MNPRVLLVKYKSPHTLVLTFDNREVRVFNYNNYLTYPVYEALKDENYSKLARVFNGTVVWDDTVDFDPDTLYLESKPLVV
ncbi:MAG: DUF2442 domain-containing protein [Chitinophagaceae bacterium]